MDRQLPSDADESLPQLLARGARSRSDGALVGMALAGFLVAAACAVARFTHWIAPAGAGAAVGALGLWGICDRELAERADGARRALAVARGAAAVLGTVAALLGAFGALRVALGTWIS